MLDDRLRRVGCCSAVVPGLESFCGPLSGPPTVCGSDVRQLCGWTLEVHFLTCGPRILHGDTTIRLHICTLVYAGHVCQTVPEVRF
jgi:hypothetical protein